MMLSLVGNDGLSLFLSKHETLIQTEIICSKIPCYMHDSACRWPIVENAKILQSCVKIF